MILFLVGASGVHIRCCLKPVEVSFLLFGFVSWLDCLLLKEGPLGDCLRCFLLLRSLRVFAQVAGFHLDDCIEYFTAPCWAPLPPLDSYRSFQPGHNFLARARCLSAGLRYLRLTRLPRHDRPRTRGESIRG